MTPILPYILLGNGEQYYFTNPDPTTLDLDMLAHSLSMLCRYTGHVKEFYSVAQHSVHVSYLVEPHLALEGLMHDAHEALVGDVATPLKCVLPGYAQLEATAAEAVAKKFELLDLPHWRAKIKRADLIALATEKRDLMPDDIQPWAMLAGVKPDDRGVIQPLPPAAAKQVFIRRYHEITQLNS